MRAIRELQVWIAENLQRGLSVQAPADRVSMSLRNLERAFTREVGKTPSPYLGPARIEAARRQLERTERGLNRLPLPPASATLTW
jgi:AraC family transcriptional regulator